MTPHEDGECRSIAALSIATQQFAIGRGSLWIADQTANVLHKTLVVGGVHGSFLVLRSLFNTMY
jgi:hypothetical protein